MRKYYSSLQSYIDNSVASALISWIVFWLVCAGGVTYVLPLIGANQYHKFYITSIYFLVCGLIGSSVYRVNTLFPHHVRFSKQLSLILIQFVLFMITALMIEYNFPVSEHIKNKILFSEFYFPLFKYEALITKFFDISFQQLMIFAILKKLKAMNLSDRRTINYFTLAFFVIHLPLFYIFGWFALNFIIPSLFAGIIFSYLILKFPFGIAKSFSVHYSFYILIGLIIRYWVY